MCYTVLDIYVHNSTTNEPDQLKNMAAIDQ